MNGMLASMTDPAPSSKTPWHIWVVGGLSLLWNAMGALDFTMTQMRNEAWLKQCTPEQLEYIHGFPLWAVLAWGIATWGSVIGSVLLLLRRRLAYLACSLVFAAMIVTMVYNYILTDGLRIMGGGAGTLIFSAVIFVIALLLLVYARAMHKRGVLR